MAPSSSSSDGLFAGITRRGPVPATVSDAAYLQAMLDAEAALARAGAGAGLFPPEHAEAIAAACVASRFDIGELGRAAAADGNPVVPLVRALTEMVDGPAAAFVHLGATSQDIFDTATMLVTRQALAAVAGEIDLAAGASARLAGANRGSLMAGRTLLQQALPITFGLKAAQWLSGLDYAAKLMAGVARNHLAVQLGGAAGTLASMGEDGPAVVRRFAEELGLAAPPVPWHTNRTGIAVVAGALGAAAGAVAKPARDVILLAQTEVAEVSEGVPGRGGSSTLPHKHNPVAAVSAVACATPVPGLVAAVLSATTGHEHERAAGAWQAEWQSLRELLTAVGSAASWLADCLAHLQVDPERMRANLDLTGGTLLAERVTTELSLRLGRLAAHDAVKRAVESAVRNGRPLAEALRQDPDLAPQLSGTEVDKLLDPSGYVGSADAFIDAALERHAHRIKDGGA